MVFSSNQIVGFTGKFEFHSGNLESRQILIIISTNMTIDNFMNCVICLPLIDLSYLNLILYPFQEDALESMVRKMIKSSAS